MMDWVTIKEVTLTKASASNSGTSSNTRTYINTTNDVFSDVPTLARPYEQVRIRIKAISFTYKKYGSNSSSYSAQLESTAGTGSSTVNEILYFNKTLPAAATQASLSDCDILYRTFTQITDGKFYAITGTNSTLAVDLQNFYFFVTGKYYQFNDISITVAFEGKGLTNVR